MMHVALTFVKRRKKSWDSNLKPLNWQPPTDLATGARHLKNVMSETFWKSEKLLDYSDLYNLYKFNIGKWKKLFFMGFNPFPVHIQNVFEMIVLTSKFTRTAHLPFVGVLTLLILLIKVFPKYLNMFQRVQWECCKCTQRSSFRAE